MASPRGQWSGKLGFILAAAGSAVGLGNLWKFPYITYENKGGAFVLVYIAAVAVVGAAHHDGRDHPGAARPSRSPWVPSPSLARGRLGGRAWSSGLGFVGVVAGLHHPQLLQRGGRLDPALHR